MRRAVEGVKLARELCEDVEFSPEDASRTELDFLAHVVEAAVEAGATTINIPDTVGYTVPDEFGELFRYLRRHVRGIDKVTLSVHCHDDLGMAVANSLTAVVAGVLPALHATGRRAQDTLKQASGTDGLRRVGGSGRRCRWARRMSRISPSNGTVPVRSS